MYRPNVANSPCGLAGLASLAVSLRLPSCLPLSRSLAKTWKSKTVSWKKHRRCGRNGTEQQNRASFEREDGASWGSGGGLEGAARTGGAARHAGQGAELRWARDSGLTRMARSYWGIVRGREAGRERMRATAERCVWDGRESCQDGPGARSSSSWSRRQQETRAWGLRSGNAPTGRTKSPRW